MGECACVSYGSYFVKCNCCIDKEEKIIHKNCISISKINDLIKNDSVEITLHTNEKIKIKVVTVQDLKKLLEVKE
ncbi:unnamed protein product [marine sediment metagenome]|uniref:Uncharacterized protein n=1 Tax=marine sediment metagenome TaxID=412755 RepID=X0UHY5_9ZZZZ